MKTKFAAALIAAILVSCGFVGTDMFPKELQYAAGGYSLASELGIEPDEMGELRIERLVSREDVNGIFVVAKRPEGWRLFSLNDNVELNAILENGFFNRFLGSTGESDRSFICGMTAIDDELEIFTPPAGGTEGGCNDNTLDLARSEYIIQYYDNASATLLTITDKPGIQNFSDIPISNNTFFTMLDSSMLASSLGNRYVILARTRNSDPASLIALSFDGIDSVTSVFGESTPLSEHTHVAKSYLSVKSVDGGWVTEDGIVVLSHHDDTRLIRYDLVTGAELDSIKIDSDWMQGLSFDDSGEHWYYYDRRTGYVKKLRTWW